MEKEIHDFEVFVGRGRIVSFTVKDGHFVTAKFKNDHGQQDLPPMYFTPDLLVKALSEFKKEYENFKPTCLLYQGTDFVIYYFERIL